MAQVTALQLKNLRLTRQHLLSRRHRLHRPSQAEVQRLFEHLNRLDYPKATPECTPHHLLRRLRPPVRILRLHRHPNTL